MKHTLLAALTTLALVGCSHANKDASTESVAKSGDERVQAQDSRQESDSTVYDGPSATGGSGSDVVTGGEQGSTPVDNAPTEGAHQTTTQDPAGSTTGATGGSGTEASSEVKEEEGTGGSGETTGSSSMDSSMQSAEESAEGAAQDAEEAASDAAEGTEEAADDLTGTGGSGTTTTSTKTKPCPDPSMKK